MFLVGGKLVVFLRNLGERIKTAIVSYKKPRKGKEKRGASSSLSLSGQLNPLDLFLSLPLENFSFVYDFFKINYSQLFSFKFT